MSGISAVTDVNNVSNNGSKLVLKFSEADTLTFNKNAVSIKSGEDTYYYTPKAIMLNGTSVSLGADYGSSFDATKAEYDLVATIDASKVLKEIKITGNDNPNYIIGSNNAFVTLNGGANADSIIAGTAGAILDGGAGNDSLVGATDKADTFVFNSGSDSIIGYEYGKDLVSVPESLRPESAVVSVDSNKNLVLDFDGGDKITFVKAGEQTENLTVSLTGGSDTYIFNKEYVAQNNSITLTSAYSAGAFTQPFQEKYYDVIDTSQVPNAISIAGNDNANTIVGSTVEGGTINSGAGSDKIDVSERKTGKSFTFVYTSGKDTVEGFEGLDFISIAENSISNVNVGGNRFTLVIDKNKNALTLDGEDVDKVYMPGKTKYFTADGIADLSGTSHSLKLFAGAKGKIDLTDEIYGADNITSVNAENVKDQSVDLEASSLGGSFKFADKNKTKDVFNYNGGNVTIEGCEANKDKINLGDYGEISGFTVEGKDVAISVSGYGNTDGVISIIGAAGQEILIHDSQMRSNAYEKKIFFKGNVLLDKGNNPVSVTIPADAGDYTVPKDSTIKKITVESGVKDIKITAGDKNNTTVDASAASGVTLIGGAKNDKFIGSEDNADVFVYGKTSGKTGKDVIQNYGDGDKVSLQGTNYSIDKVKKITASDTSVKFMFDDAEALTIKGKKGDLDTISVNGTDYSFKKNAVINDGKASLTSAASGTFKLDKLGVNYINATGTTDKNLTLTGTNEDDTIMSGGKKAVLKGNGGNDSLVGGSGADTFFYAKGNEGNVTIEKFDFGKDSLKIANGTITEIKKDNTDKTITFSMNNGRKNGDVIGTFKLTTKGNGKTFDPNKVIIKANNVSYWFATGNETPYSDSDEVKIGRLITRGSKEAVPTGWNVIDLGYSTNLVKTNVAIKVKDAKPGTN
ncbi:MAG: hypothetical protein IKZ53_04680 [Selenomonadaceae bacterium]|nr:hypothetical protein [Selenomonadaceae bacterium]